jgi:hypothetical protein
MPLSNKGKAQKVGDLDCALISSQLNILVAEGLEVSGKVLTSLMIVRRIQQLTRKKNRPDSHRPGTKVELPRNSS